MTKKHDDQSSDPEPSGGNGPFLASAPANASPGPSPEKDQTNFLDWMKAFIRRRPESSLREALEDYIEETDGTGASVAAHERALISNVLALRDMTVVDVMIPRVDIAAITVDTTREELFQLLAERQFSRLPVYRETLDDVVGTIHIKDILAQLATGHDLVVRDLVRDVPIVSPAMPVLDLLLQMRQSRRHMVLVVDEYGGIDGLVTIGDMVEAIMGEIEDEFDSEDQPEITEKPDGSVTADARVDIGEFERRYGSVLTEEEREESDTLGGLVFYLAGRVPARGEVITHESGMVFEIADADPRRVKLLRIRNIPRTVPGE